ncbi:MAG: PIN domain-containing protein [Solirubrobacterales bacterium]|nr:PIN domain-containing protein [Solirubrobacterales bacterium]
MASSTDSVASHRRGARRTIDELIAPGYGQLIGRRAGGGYSTGSRSACRSSSRRAGHRRLSPVDLLIAALAHRHGQAILHFDRDYDLIAERTTLAFESVWLMAA